VNRPLRPGDCRNRGTNTGRPSGPAGAVPGAGRLVGRTQVAAGRANEEKPLRQSPAAGGNGLRAVGFYHHIFACRRDHREPALAFALSANLGGWVARQAVVASLSHLGLNSATRSPCGATGGLCRGAWQAGWGNGYAIGDNPATRRQAGGRCYVPEHC
jgi:hypothetical protein